MKASEWIDQVKAAKGWESDYRAAKELGLSRNTVSNWRVRPDATMDDDTALKVAEALGEAPALVLIDQAAERSKSERARLELMHALESVRGKLRAAARVVGGGKGRIDITSVAATTLLAGAAFFGAPPPVQAGDVGSSFDQSTHRINRRRRRSSMATDLADELAQDLAIVPMPAAYGPSFAPAFAHA